MKKIKIIMVAMALFAITSCSIEPSTPCDKLIEEVTQENKRYSQHLANGYRVDRDMHVYNINRLDSMISKVCNCK